MFWILALFYVSIDIYSLTTSNFITFDRSGYLAQIQLLTACLLGTIASINPSPKRKSAMIVLLFGTLMLLLTNVVHDYVYWIEISLYAFGLLWAAARPYEFISDPVTEDTVCLVFYKQNGGSWLMHVLSLIGLPMASMSIIAEGRWLKLVIGNPGLEIHPAEDLDCGKYVVVDTGVKITEKIRATITNLNGEPAVNKKSLFLRVRCIAAVKHLLAEIGVEWRPRTVIQQIPSMYFYKALWNRQQGQRTNR